MRPLTENEKTLIIQFSEKLNEGEKIKLLDDLEHATATENTDKTRIIFSIANYQRPVYQGQHQFEAEGRMLNDDDTELSVCLYADENGRLLELEFIRWSTMHPFNPKWDTLKVY